MHPAPQLSLPTVTGFAFLQSATSTPKQIAGIGKALGCKKATVIFPFAEKYTERTALRLKCITGFIPERCLSATHATIPLA
jgi:hypothetical protein